MGEWCVGRKWGGFYSPRSIDAGTFPLQNSIESSPWHLLPFTLVLSIQNYTLRPFEPFRPASPLLFITLSFLEIQPCPSQRELRGTAAAVHRECGFGSVAAR